MKTLILTTLAATGLATASIAEEGLYYGAGLGFAAMSSESFPDGPNTSEVDTFIVGGTVGYRWETPTMFYAAELDGDFSFGAEFDDSSTGAPCVTNANGPYYCTHDATLRLRGLVGTDVGGGTELFGSLGLAYILGTSAVGPSIQADIESTGFTAGFGMQRPLATGIGRVELIYDYAEDSNAPGSFDPTYEAVTIKGTFLF